MVEAVFRCNVCKDGKLYTSKEANEHKLKTGHNSWRILKRGVRTISEHDGI